MLHDLLPLFVVHVPISACLPASQPACLPCLSVCQPPPTPTRTPSSNCLQVWSLTLTGAYPSLRVTEKVLGHTLWFFGGEHFSSTRFLIFCNSLRVHFSPSFVYLPLHRLSHQHHSPSLSLVTSTRLQCWPLFEPSCQGSTRFELAGRGLCRDGWEGLLTPPLAVLVAG